MSSPLVSIVVPVYNTAPWLRRCLDSLKAQTLSGIEVILINDASTDESTSICEHYCKTYPDLFYHFYQDQHLGPGASRNAGILLARGEYLGFVDSDDYVSPEMFQSLYSAAIEGEFDIALGGFYEITTDKQVEKLPPRMSAEELLLNRAWQSSLWNKLFKREFISSHEVLFPESSFAEDMSFVAKVLFLNPRLCVVQHALYYYCKRDSSLTFTLRNRKEVFISLKDMYDFGKQKKTKLLLRAYSKHFFFQAIYYPACLLFIDAIIKGQRPLDNFKDVPCYLWAMFRHVLGAR